MGVRHCRPKFGPEGGRYRSLQKCSRGSLLGVVVGAVRGALSAPRRMAIPACRVAAAFVRVLDLLPYPSIELSIWLDRSVAMKRGRQERWVILEKLQETLAISETAAVPFVINPVGAFSARVSKLLGNSVWVTAPGSHGVDTVKLISDRFGDCFAPRMGERTLFERLETGSKI